MKKIILSGLAIALSVMFHTAYGDIPKSAREAISELQARNENFQTVSLFRSPENRSVPGTGAYIRLMLDEQALQVAFKSNYPSVKLALPMPDGTEMNLLLTQH